METGWTLWALMAVPAALAGLCLAARTARQALAAVAFGGAAWAVGATAVAVLAFARGPLEAAGGWLRIDALSAWHVVILALVFGAGSVYARGYFATEAAAGHFDRARARRFGALWFGSAAAMASVLVNDNLGLMWVSVEATTLITAFLICVHVTPLSLEAMWKYLVVCSVGVAFAFVGTLFTGAAAAHAGLRLSDRLLWTRLAEDAVSLDASLMKFAFLFVVVGYGTKAGLAPLHSWLPDAHSQAPAPVSALFSGFMLNAALYCLMRFLPIVAGATGSAEWGREVLLVMGLVSILVAAAFIVFQRDGKRLLAYHSVEHMGIIAVGLGLGGIGAFAALWHALNHAVCKSLTFFAVGKMGQIYGTHDLEGLSGAMKRTPLWGAAFFGGVLALIGAAPFAIFMSEFQVLRAAASSGAWVALGLFLAGAGVVFVAALRHAIAPVWGCEVGEARPIRSGAGDVVIVVAGLGILLVLGLWLPGPVRSAIESAAKIIEVHP